MISRQDAAELLDCNIQTVTNWVERGLLKGHIIGRVHIKNCKTIADLVKFDRADLMSARNFGQKCFSEVDELVSSLGLHWGMDIDLMTKEELKKWTKS